MTLTLPLLEKEYFRKIGCKNIIKQLLLSNITGECRFISSHRGYSVIEIDSKQIVLAKDISMCPIEYEYAIKVTKQATNEAIQNNEITLIKWLKHPLDMGCTTDEILESWVNNFNFIEEDIEREIKGLREPQIASLYSILSHIKVSDEMGIVVMPTGTGKTETMLSTLVANCCRKTLITVPSDALREQIFNKFYTLGLLKKFGIVGAGVLYPRVGIIKEKFSNIEELSEFVNKSNVVVTTMNLLSNFSNEMLSLMAETFEHVFIDEAHHSEANSWSRVRSSFSNKQILQFTATPFRNDGKRLDGKIIFNFPLRKAQEQGYFKHINFVPIREYDLEKGDKLIAQKAVEQLRGDIAQRYDHILMARCENKKRAEDIFKLYEEFTDLNPVLIHSSVLNRKELMHSIVNGEHKIIVTVDMLGEGFDLPQLKIAAFHDIRKSLPITLQFAGRFTRTSFDNNLGNATFIANLADAKVEEELAELYARDADWNILLSDLSADQTDEKIELDEFIRGFSNIDKSNIPFQNIRMALSTVVYKNSSSTCDLLKFKYGLTGYKEFEYKFEYMNSTENTLVSIYADTNDLDWVNYKEIYELQWNLMVLYYDTRKKLLYIHSSDKSSLYKDVAMSVLGNNAILLNELNVFKVFHNISRISLQNVGLKEWLNKHIRFRMLTGTDIEEALSSTAQSKAQRAFVFGTGYDAGIKISLGCSYKGRIWSYARGNLKEYIKWCDVIGKKIIDPTIDPNQILKDTLVPKFIDAVPNKFPVCIDWDESYYDFSDTKKGVDIDGIYINAIDLELEVDSTQQGKILFSLVTPIKTIQYEQKIIQSTDPISREQSSDFSIVQLSSELVEIVIGTKKLSFVNYLMDNVPIIWFADGSSLQGIRHIELKQLIQSYPSKKLIAWNWSGVDLKNEAQGVYPLVTNSIQYKTIEKLKTCDYDIIFDDDGSGEIADIVTIKESDNEIYIQFYHLKFAHGDTVGKRVSDFYEVCGQAQKSINWKHKSGFDFFERLLKREIKHKNGHERSRIEKGSKEDLERLLLIAKNKKPVKFEIFIVQPGLSKTDTNEAILTLLGVTESYLKEVGGVKLGVIVNE